MSTEQPEDDRFRKPDRPDGPEDRSPPPPPSAGGPYGDGSAPPPPPPPPPPPHPGGGEGAESPYGGPGGPPPAGPYGTEGPYGSDSPYGTESPYGGNSPYGSDSPYGANPYGDRAGAADPLAGMPPLANRGKRLLARIIDALIIAIPIGIIMAFGWDGYNSGGSARAYAQNGIYTLVYFVYEGIMLTRSGQTVGKKLMRIRVAVLADGAVPEGATGWLRAGVYQLPALVPCLGSLFWLVNVLFCTWDRPYHQCLHDKAARTVVVETG